MMIEEDHSALLAALLLHKGPVIISGYDHKLYNETLKGWRKIEHIGRSNSAAPRREILRMNFDGKQRTLFD